MTQLKNKRTRSKSNGFLLADAVFAVFVTLLTVVTLQNMLKSMTTADKAHHRADDIVFAYVQFDHFLKEDAKTVYLFPAGTNSRQVAIKKVSQRGKTQVYILASYKDMIRMRTPEGGHMPLLLNVKKASFISKDQQTKISVVEKDGRSSEIYFKLDAKPKTTKNEKRKNDEIKG